MDARILETRNNNCLWFIVLLLLTLSPYFAYSQEDYQEQIDDIFEIPQSKVTTGVLIERSLDIVDMQEYNLATNPDSATFSDVNKWMGVYYRIYASHLSLQSFTHDITIANRYPYKVYPNDTIPLGLIFYNYNKIKEDALTNGLLSVDTLTDKIYDTSGAGQTPLEVAACFAASPLADTKVTRYGCKISNEVRFEFEIQHN